MIFVKSRDFERRVSARTVGELFKKLNLSVGEFVVSKNGEIVLEDEKLRSGDIIKLYPVISGG